MAIPHHLLPTLLSARTAATDLNPLWMAAGATFTVAGAGTGQRTVPADEFFVGYRRVDLAPHELLLSVSLPFTARHEYVKEFKQAHRRDDDIAIVNAGMRFRMVQAEGEWRWGGRGREGREEVWSCGAVSSVYAAPAKQ